MTNEVFEKILAFGQEQERLGNKVKAIVTDRQKFIGNSDLYEFERDIMGFPKDKDLVINLYNFRDEYFYYEIEESMKIRRKWSGSFYKLHQRAESIMVIGMYPMDVELLI